MRKIIAAGILMIIACVNTYSQDTSKLKSKKLPPYVKDFGPYTVTMEDGKITSMVKNPKFDWSKAIKRDTSTRFKRKSTVEIYTANSEKLILSRYLIYGHNSVSSIHLMSRNERMAKYNSTDGVDVIHLKEGAIPLNAAELLSKFGIAKQNANLPIFIDFRPVAEPDEMLAIPDAVLRIDVTKDGDGFRFLNIVTKEWDAEQKKYAGQQMLYIR